MTQRWTFITPTITFVLDRNPAEIDASLFTQDGNYSSTTGNVGYVRPGRLTFTAKINSQSAYDLLVAVTSERNAVTLIDHLNRSWTIRFTSFTSTQNAPKRLAHPWRQSYSVEAMILGGPS